MRRAFAAALCVISACATSQPDALDAGHSPSDSPKPEDLAADDVPISVDAVTSDFTTQPDVSPPDVATFDRVDVVASPDVATFDRVDVAASPDVVATPDVAAAPDVVTSRDVVATPDVVTTPDVARADTPPAMDVARDAPSCGATLPAGWPARWTLWSANPALVASVGAPLQGHDNVYAPDLHAVDGAWAMFYGAQGGDGHDRICVAVSRDGGAWRKWPADLTPTPVLDRGASNHVNDPSAVRVDGRWRMYYTDAATGEDDRVWLAEGDTLTNFHRVAMVLDVGPAGSWEAEKVGRPSVLYEGGVYRMWYDGQAGGRRHVGYATSTDGVHFVRHPMNPVFRDAGAVDVKRVGGVYVMLREGTDGTAWATSDDGLCWTDRGRLFATSGAAYDRYGQVTPTLQVDGATPIAIWFGGASVASWDHNRIAVAFPEGAAAPPSGGGCTACVAAGQSCAAACLGDGHGRTGTCGAPGSTDSSRCCACADEGCGACTTAADCHAACVSVGAASGWCAFAGSTDPSRCCACVR